MNYEIAKSNKPVKYFLKRKSSPWKCLIINLSFKLHSVFLIFSIFLCCPVLIKGQLKKIEENPIWPRSVIIPVPDSVSGIKDPIISLNGTWLIKGNPQGDFWNQEIDIAGWIETKVPNSRHSVPGIQDKIFAYRKRIMISNFFIGKRAILRFDGVSNAARLWVNGLFVREHWGSYMAWTCDVTNFIKPGEESIITLEVNDKEEGLAKYVFGGGIQRDVKMYALPINYLTCFHVETDFDNEYKNAILRIRIGIAFHDRGKSSIRLKLFDPLGRNVSLVTNEVTVDNSRPEVIVEIPIVRPVKWDAEHPNLYTLEASVISRNNPIEVITRRIGFREVERRGKHLYINGNEVKLRGIMLGEDLPLMRSANINHTRQKWATEDLLDACDSVGMYVLDENPVNFVKYGPENDSKCAYQWLNLISDLMERDYSHPSVIIWGLGNESFHGKNVTKTFQYVNAEDPSRPTIFSWSQQIPPDEDLPFSIFSYHYPDNNLKDSDFASYGAAIFNYKSIIPYRKAPPEMPILFDESAHIALVNTDEQKHDPNVHNFWGESMKFFWEKVFTIEGVLGCDVFGLWMEDIYINKPEYWLIKKAFSPIRIKDEPISNPGNGKPVIIPIKNWFDHTNLTEIKIKWMVANDSGVLKGPDIKSHSEGILTIPPRKWKSGDTLNLEFLMGDAQVVDEFKLPIEPLVFQMPAGAGFGPDINENEQEIVISGPKFKIVINKYLGQITEGSYLNNVIITGGPYVTLLGSNLSLPDWWPFKITAKKEINEAVVEIKGAYISFNVAIVLRIDGQGMITTNYCIETIPDLSPQAKFLPWNKSTIGGYSEVGIAFDLSADVDRLTWKRKGLWSVYPDNHIGRNEGTAYRNPIPGKEYLWPTSDKDVRLYGRNDERAGRGTNDFRGSKEYIYTATAWISSNKKGIQAVSEGKDAVRMELLGGTKESKIRMYINNEWNYPNLGLGNLMKAPIMTRPGYSNTIKVRLVDVVE